MPARSLRASPLFQTRQTEASSNGKGDDRAAGGPLCSPRPRRELTATLPKLRDPPATKPLSNCHSSMRGPKSRKREDVRYGGTHGVLVRAMHRPATIGVTRMNPQNIVLPTRAACLIRHSAVHSLDKNLPAPTHTPVTERRSVNITLPTPSLLPFTLHHVSCSF